MSLGTIEQNKIIQINCIECRCIKQLWHSLIYFPVEFVTFAPAPPAQLPEEPVGAPAVQSILVAGEEDIRWVCEDMGLKDPEELRSYMERIRGSS